MFKIKSMARTFSIFLITISLTFGMTGIIPVYAAPAKSVGCDSNYIECMDEVNTYPASNAADWRQVQTLLPTGNVPSLFSWPLNNVVDAVPTVQSIVRAGASPANTSNIYFTVTFAQDVTGVDTTAPFNDFSLTTTGVTDAFVSAVSGAGSTRTVTVNTGSGDGTICLNINDDDTIIDTVGNPLGGAGIGNGDFVTGEIYTIDKTKPIPFSILRNDPSPSSAVSVSFTFTFTEPVTGVDISDFGVSTLVGGNGVNNAFVSKVVPVNTLPTDSSYIVTVNTGSGNGTLYLFVYSGIGILDNAGNPVFEKFYGEDQGYVMDKTVTRTLQSIGAQDGWLLESSENSDTGGYINTTATSFVLGDDIGNKQYRGLLSFNTGSLPDTAIITGITLKVKKAVIIGGGDPMTIFHGLMIDVKSGMFGTAALQTSDFQLGGNAKAYDPNPALVTGWYSINLTGQKAFINKLSTNSGLTQMRLRFDLDDNNNAAANYIRLYSGNATLAADRPQLVITYIVP